jgi:hypothetical protein
LLLTCQCCCVLSCGVELTTDATVDGGRRLLCFAGNCVRPLSRTQSHKVGVTSKNGTGVASPVHVLLVSVTHTPGQRSTVLKCTSTGCNAPCPPASQAWTVAHFVGAQPH